MHVLIRCDASNMIGTGHVVRCLTLAHGLTTAGGTVDFLVSRETIATMPVLSSQNFKIIDVDGFPAMPDADLLIVDHYGLDFAYESSMRSYVKKIMVIDDLADRVHDCDILLDQTFGRLESDYHALVPAHTRLLCGSQYALLRPQFAAARRQALKRREERRALERLLVFMGGADPDNLTRVVLSSLADVSGLTQIDIVMGQKSLHLADTQKRAVQMPIPTTLHTGLDAAGMISLMSAADLCIGAGGTASWERCCLGLPALVVQIADNQVKITKELAQVGAIMDLGWHEDLSKTAITHALETLKSAPEKLQAMSRKAADICDGRGLQSVINFVLS